ncbi:MAG TPA: penicillin-binding protein activator LpoB [Candidatus Acidoferrales bacterium]|nr:penicillin-binding protein activator LpoB [Candidatus Acidoferrales bacterium]
MKYKMFLILIPLLLIGCSSSRQVSRVSADTDVDLSGNWNDTDSRLVAEQMISSLTTKPWLDDFTSQNSKKPAVIVGTVRNLSSEHIQTDAFIDDIERELVNSGKVTFVASKKERQEVRQERLDQQTNATEESAKKLAAETGADYMLQGSIKDIVDRVEGKEVKYYQVDMVLVDLQTSEKVWMDTKKIKKVIDRPSSSW